jgi:hypothetical protein
LRAKPARQLMGRAVVADVPEDLPGSELEEVAT